jgi:hypothetical protein
LALNLRLFNLKVNYEIVELDDFTGKGATVYSVIMECSEVTLFDEFLQENMATYREEVKSILGRLKQMGVLLGQGHSSLSKMKESQVMGFAPYAMNPVANSGSIV